MAIGAWWVWLNDRAVWLLLGGLAAIALWNGYRWRQDRTLALQLRDRNGGLRQLEGTHTISVLVAAWNEADIIRDHIESFLGLQYLNKELLLCAGGEDGTQEIALEYAGENVSVLQQQRGEGKQRALQRCFEQAKGEVMFLTDADCLLDDSSFARTVAPVLSDEEHVTTGMSRPLHWQQHNAFVVYQWCVDAYAAARLGKYVSGIKGANCCVRREALDVIEAFQTDAPIGTDYYLSKRLQDAGFCIRYVPNSINETEYSETVRSYVSRQSRWLRNLVLHGRKFGATDEVSASLRTSLVGLAMLLLPLSTLVMGRISTCAWYVAFVHSLMAKARYFRFTELRHGVDLDSRGIVLWPLFVVVDFVAWAMPVVDYLLPWRRHRW